MTNIIILNITELIENLNINMIGNLISVDTKKNNNHLFILQINMYHKVKGNKPILNHKIILNKILLNIFITIKLLVFKIIIRINIVEIRLIIIILIVNWLLPDNFTIKVIIINVIISIEIHIEIQFFIFIIINKKVASE